MDKREQNLKLGESRKYIRDMLIELQYLSEKNGDTFAVYLIRVALEEVNGLVGYSSSGPSRPRRRPQG